MTKPYGPYDEFFNNSAFLVFCNRLVSVMFCIGVMIWNNESFEAIAPHWAYASISLCNLAATFCQYEALKYLSFPLQTVLKNGKVVMVLSISRCVLRKQYGWRDYGIAFVIMFGCSLFALTGDITARHSSNEVDPVQTMIGFIIMITYLFFDGFTSTFQEKLFRGYVMSTNHQMLYVNAYSMLLSIIGLTATGQLTDSISFITRNPNLLADAFELSLCSTFGQQVIYVTIKEFGNVLLSTVMTTRQMLSIVISSILYSHHLSIYQWLSASIVSGCLYYSNYTKSGSHSGHDRTKARAVTPKDVDIETSSKSREPV